MILLLLACAPDDPPDDATPPHAVGFVPLSDARLARRISIDLLGRLPTPDEVAQAEEPGGIAALIDTWLDDPALETHLVDVFAETWLLRLDELRVAPSEFGLSDADDQYRFTRAVGDEPAHVLAHVAASDGPWTDIVTTDTTFANDLLVSIFPLAYTDSGVTSGDWREARYTDGRPAGGVLMTSGLWLRYHTTLFNYNRGRAAALARLLLCHDFLMRPVAFTPVEDSTTAGLDAAVSTDPGCLACHATLDPLAGTLFGFWPFEDKDGSELVTYHPERERYSEELTGNEPAYFGTPVAGASELGPLVANDPRFQMCAVARTAGTLWGRTTDDDDLPEVVALRDEFRAGDLRYKALLRAVVATDEYRAGALDADATDEDLARYRTLRQLSPNTLASVVEQATGFRWTISGWDQLDSDQLGYRVLLGGADGDLVRQPTLDPTLSRSLVIRRLAQAAADAAVSGDVQRQREDRLLLGTTVEWIADITSGSPEFDAELDEIHLRLFSTLPTDDQRRAEADLWDSAYALAGEHGAWTSLVAVLLRDPDFWSY